MFLIETPVVKFFFTSFGEPHLYNGNDDTNVKRIATIDWFVCPVKIELVDYSNQVELPSTESAF